MSDLISDMKLFFFTSDADATPVNTVGLMGECMWSSAVKTPVVASMLNCVSI